ncbi:EF-P 5-aminopentanol modification-associated protein YfmF [Caldalkalibacillus salinus]|uniref:EF-P 5-aminopentanol modification-associated protein YfmF n=1 Tax=Caldalkalibacillus salinus TaxID=2803787 RepID=UPI0019246FA2|nr:pitrilysin family protein [Caldalkalibacillus salinus]
MTLPFLTEKVNDIPVHIYPTDKYKTNFISLYIRQPLADEHHTKVALIPQILNRGTEKYPTAGQFKQALEELYGASLNADVMKRGEEQIIVFRMQMANEKFLSDQTPLLEKGIELLSEVLLRPLTENDSFVERHVDIEKELLKRRLEQIKDDKMRYANKRCVEEMFAEERFRLFSNGSLDQIIDLSPKQLYQYYRQMIESHPIELFVAGDVDKDQVKNTVQQHLQLPRGEQIKMHGTEIKKEVVEEREVVERTKISQGKLHIGCRTATVYNDDDYVALQVCNGVFGGFSHSKLFQHVREKESLAYYVSSSVESHKGFMMIMSGIEFKNYQKTVDIIKQQLKETANGNITDEELNQTKAVLVNQILESEDQPFQQMERYMHGIIGRQQRPSEELIEKINQVTKEDIQKVAKKIKVDTIYFLTSEEEGE